jgi:omega-amidase
MSNTPLRISLLQMEVKAGEPEANFAKVQTMLEEEVSTGPKPDLIVLPEMWNTGYALDRIRELADPQGERTRALFSAFCRTHKVNVVAGSIAEGKEDGVYNTVYVFNRNGELSADYSKIHLFGLMDEDKHLAAGTKTGGFQLDGISAGAMICYDIRFPELARTLALGGAEILFVPAEWPHPRLNHWRTLLLARAIENQMIVVSCNRVGISGDTSFFGHSMIIDPWGEIIAEGGEEETVIRAEVDLAEVGKVRKTIPVFRDRRPDRYGQELLSE